MKKSDVLQINLLGPLEIRRGSNSLELPPSKKARGMLAWLVANSRRHRRDRLTELLWDVADDPRGGLRWCLSKIRPLVDEPHVERIVADRETVEFLPENSRVDLYILRNALKGGVSSLQLTELQDLSSLFRGVFLEGLDLPDYDGFQSWLVAAREDLRQQHVSILRAIVGAMSHDPGGAITYARQLVQIDPLDEHSRAQLCGLLVRLGRHAEAQQLLETGKRLARELGGENSGELARAERELEAPARIENRRDMFRNPEPALVGRNEETARLRAALEKTRNNSAGIAVLVSGEPGVGKTRFLLELAAHTSSARGTVLYGRSYEAEARRPYGPWVDALRSLHPSTMGEVLRESLAPLLTGLVREDDEGVGSARPGGKERLFASIVELLAARAHSAPPVLLQFDDIQWCDEASAELLHYVVRMTRHRPISVILSARSGELPDNEAISRVLRGFRRDRWIDEIQLGPLSQQDTIHLVTVVAPQADAKAVFDESAGNPLYALELARAPGLSDRTAGSTLAGLIRDRIDRLPEHASGLLRWAAVLGSTFALDRLSDFASLDPDEFASALEILDKHGLVRISSAVPGATSCSFTHGIVRRSVYDDLSEPRRRLMHARIAKALEREAASPAAASEVAHHAALAGEAAMAARASLAAGRYCLRVYANGEALAFARAGLRYSEGMPESERTGLQIELMEVGLAARRPGDVEDTARQLEELAEKSLSYGDVERARLGFHLLSYLRWEGGDWSDAQRHSLRAEFVARRADDKEQIVAMAEAARCLALLERDLGQAEALALEAKARAARTGVDAVAIPDALGMLRFHQGAWEEASKFFSTARDLAQQQGDWSGEFRALEHLVVLELERNRPSHARALCGRLLELAEKLREGSEAPFARCLAALAGGVIGEGAAEELDSALQSLRMADAKHRLAYALLRTALADLERSDFRKAHARGEEALRAAETLQRPSETAMAHVVLLRCAAGRNASREVARHTAALRETDMVHVAAHVRKAVQHVLTGMKGASPGTRTR